jgi:phthalate 4,5-cis-dihydrodiol dehydrogenase
VQVYADDAVRLEPLPKPEVPRAEVIDELYDVVVNGGAPVHSGEWARATLEVCLAVLQSARERREVDLTRQVGLDERHG